MPTPTPTTALLGRRPGNISSRLLAMISFSAVVVGGVTGVFAPDHWAQSVHTEPGRTQLASAALLVTVLIALVAVYVLRPWTAQRFIRSLPAVLLVALGMFSAQGRWLLGRGANFWFAVNGQGAAGGGAVASAPEFDGWDFATFTAFGACTIIFAILHIMADAVEATNPPGK
jgi:uncharacterized membrane protein